MKKILIFLMLIYLNIVYSNMFTVSQDGTGDHTAIQIAINFSVDEDSILVYPGIYFENIDYSGKTIVIGSLNMTTGEEQYIHSTVIDGSNNGRVINLENYEQEGTSLIGFTIRNGNANRGAGIYLDYAHLNVINCIIENNSGSFGSGGIASEFDAGIFLSGTTIRNNFSDSRYGGISISNQTDLEFDPENLCNIYNNHGAFHCDLAIGIRDENPIIQHVYLDTFSCITPDRYFIGVRFNGINLNLEYLDLQVNTAYFEFYDGDIYVSPDGDDDNSGISPEEPMQTIAGAMTRIISNPENPNTIYLAEGTYSPSLNDQIFPLNMKGHVNIIGEDMNTVIWDGDGHGFINDYYSGFEYEISNITFMDGPLEPNEYLKFYCQNEESYNVYLNNLKIIDPFTANIVFTECIDFEINNIIVEGGTGGLLGYYCKPGRHSIARNCIISGSGGTFAQFCYDDDGERPRFDAINILSTDNNCPYERGIWSYNIHNIGYTEMNLINCTIMNNTSDDPVNDIASVNAKLGANFNIYNSCIYGNDGYEVAADTGIGGVRGSTINISHSLIEGGEEGIPLVGDYPSTLNWLEGNMDCDPLACVDYTPQNGSPLIDAGTLDLPYDIEIPLTDVYGNPRFYGNAVDIGAIEWQGTGNNYDEIVEKPDELIIYPNPLITGNLRDGKAKILWLGEDTDDLSFEIFNIKGQRLRKLNPPRRTRIENVIHRGGQECKMNSVEWDLCDDAGDVVSSGVYFVRVKAGDEYQSQQKVTVIR